MRRGHGLRPRRMHPRVDRERRRVHRVIALDDLAVLIHQHQIAHANLPEMHAERIDPELVGILRIARRDVPRDAFVITVPREQSERGRQPLLTMQPFLGVRCEHRRNRNILRSSRSFAQLYFSHL